MADNPSDDPHPESCEIARSQAEFLLKDEIGYASALRSSRNTVGSLLVLVVGVGLFQMDLFGSPDEQPRVHAWALWSIRGLTTLSTICFLVGMYWVYTERPGKKKQRQDEQQNPILKPHPFQRGTASAALAVLHLTPQFRAKMESKPPEWAARAQSRIMGIAYERLVAKNRRVRYRIEVGRRWIFGCVGLLFVAFLMYLWGLKGPVPDDDAGHVKPAETPRWDDHTPAA